MEASSRALYGGGSREQYVYGGNGTSFTAVFQFQHYSGLYISLGLLHLLCSYLFQRVFGPHSES